MVADRNTTIDPQSPATPVAVACRRKIRTLSKLQRKLLRSPFGFQNCTKTAKYEALEENVVSNRKCRPFGNL
jgi:hypothetical protein